MFSMYVYMNIGKNGICEVSKIEDRQNGYRLLQVTWIDYGLSLHIEYANTAKAPNNFERIYK